MSDQMQLFPCISVKEIDPIVLQVSDLFMSGLHWLNIIAKNEPKILFSQWAKLLRNARVKIDELDRTKLEWLWESITSEPHIRDFLGDRLISLEDEWKGLEQVECYPAHSCFGIFFKSFHALGYPTLALSNDLRPDAEATILGPLYMKPGRARRLECGDVPTHLKIQLQGHGTIDAEAAALKVDVNDVSIENGWLKVNVKSLNHAYTKASLRLEPQRRSHGGRVYDHIAFKTDKGFVPLETTRNGHEERLWKEILAI